jgi:hypothetical protein
MTASLKPCWRRIARSLARRATVVCAKARIFGLALVPPVGQRALGIDVDQHDRAGAGALRLDRQMPDSVVLPDPPFCEANAKTRKA